MTRKAKKISGVISLGIDENKVKEDLFVKDKMRQIFGTSDASEFKDRVNEMNEGEMQLICMRAGVSSMGGKITVKTRLLETFERKMHAIRGELNQTIPSHVSPEVQKRIKLLDS